MKKLAIMLIVPLCGDLALFSGAYSQQLWSSTRQKLESIQAYADEQTGSLTRT